MTDDDDTTTTQSRAAIIDAICKCPLLTIEQVARLKSLKRPGDLSWRDTRFILKMAKRGLTGY